MSRWRTTILSLLAILAGGFLIIRTFTSNPNQFSLQAQLPDTSTVSTDTDSPSTDFSLLEQANLSLQATVSSLLNRIEQLEQDQSAPAASEPVTTAPAPAPAVVFQPQTIFLGSASTTNTDWTETGVEVSLYSFDYPDDAKVYFEAGLSIIGGEAWARVKNKTTGAVIHTTELFHNNNTITWKYSPAFKLHSGNNTYVIEMKSTSHEKANLAGARLKLTQ